MPVRSELGRGCEDKAEGTVPGGLGSVAVRDVRVCPPHNMAGEGTVPGGLGSVAERCERTVDG